MIKFYFDLKGYIEYKVSDEIKKIAEIYFTEDAKAEHQKVIDAGGPG